MTEPERGVHEATDVVVVGAGVAGLYAALKLAPRSATVLTATSLAGDTASTWAQGGIAAAVGPGDSPHDHAADTLRAAGEIADPAAVDVLTAEAAVRIEDLARLGVRFDRDARGRFALSQEGGHSRRRVLRTSGDTFGREIMRALLTAVRATPSVSVRDGVVAEELLCHEGRVLGVSATRRSSGARITFGAKAVVLATGGIGGLYAQTTNPLTACGQGLSMAARAGAILADLEFVQFHPTALDVGVDPAPLATEALRGEGAVLCNSQGVRFMAAVHGDAELAPRDVVSRAIFRERRSGMRVLLDCRPVAGRLAGWFPALFKACQAAGLDPRLDPIPVMSAAHYHMGGIATDLNGCTSLRNLWACGEVAATGVHGANRLASNSLLEAVVFAFRAAYNINSAVDANLEAPTAAEIMSRGANTRAAIDPRRERDLTNRLRRLMWERVGIVRSEASLTSAFDEIAAIERAAGTGRRLRDMLIVARLITTAALIRRESRGSHFRVEFPSSLVELRRRSFMTLREAEEIAASINAISDEEGRITA